MGHDVGRPASHRPVAGQRRLPPVRLDAPPTWRCGSGSPPRPPAAGWTSCSTGRQPVGLVGRPAAAARVVTGSIWTRCPTGELRRAARRRLLLRRARCSCGSGARAGRRPLGDRQLRRRGGCPVRARLRRVAADRRGAAADAGPGADRRRRRHPGRRAWRPPGTTRTRIGPDDERLAPHRRLRRAARRAGPGLSTWRARSASPSAIWPHGRWRFDFRGEANHAGTTRLDDRRDPMLALCRGRPGRPRRRPARRCASPPSGKVRRRAQRRQRDPLPGHAAGWTPAAADAATSGPWSPSVDGGRRPPRRQRRRSRSPPVVEFDPALRDRRAPARARRRPGAPHRRRTRRRHPRRAGIPTAMLFVRNPTGVSHSPAEHAEEATALAGVSALAAVLEELAAVTAGTRARLRAGYAAAPGCRPPARHRRRGRRRGRPHRRGRAGRAAPGGAERLRGLVLPGLANAHSHAFHRALRGATQIGGGTFWTWREHMYAVAARLDPGHATSRWPARRTPRWRSPASPRSASSTTCTTRPAARRTPTRTPWARRWSQAAAEAGHPDHPARHLLPLRRLRRGRRDRRSAPVLRRRRRTAGPSAVAALQGRRRRRPGRRRCRDPLGPGRARRPAGGRRRAGPTRRARRCTSHVSEQPAENEACLAAYGVHAHPRCSPTTASSARAPPPCTPPTSPTRTSRCSAAPARRSACAPPPSATSPTASARPSRCRRAGSPLSPRRPTATPSSTCSRRRAPGAQRAAGHRQRGHWTRPHCSTPPPGAGHASLGRPDAGHLDTGARRRPGRGAARLRPDRRRAPLRRAVERVVFAATAADVTDVVVVRTPGRRRRPAPAAG